jgi:hypothetical protein
VNGQAHDYGKVACATWKATYPAVNRIPATGRILAALGEGNVAFESQRGTENSSRCGTKRPAKWEDRSDELFALQHGLPVRHQSLVIFDRVIVVA